MNSLANPRQAAAQLLNFGLILSTAFMVWLRERTRFVIAALY